MAIWRSRRESIETFATTATAGSPKAVECGGWLPFVLQGAVYSARRKDA